jgi:hypothetical protein
MSQSRNTTTLDFILVHTRPQKNGKRVDEADWVKNAEELQENT